VACSGSRPRPGYIGGSVLLRFLNRPDVSSLNLTALVRSQEKAEELKSLGVNAVVGSHSDLPLMEKLASEADVVLAMV
jgi:Trk K+ transport system NAD-binding subunit